MTVKRSVDPIGMESSYLQAVGAGNTVRYALGRPRMTVGRNADSDIVIPETTVSVCHATLECVGDEVKVVDQESTNGTFVNGKRIHSKVLQDGDRVSFDQFEFKYHEPNAGAAGTVRREGAAFEETEPREALVGAPKTEDRVDDRPPRNGGRGAPTVPSGETLGKKKGSPVLLHIAAVVAAVLTAIVIGLLVRGNPAGGETIQEPTPVESGVVVADPAEGPAEAAAAGTAEAQQAPSATAPSPAASASATTSSQTIDRVILAASYHFDLPGEIEGAAALADLNSDGSPDLIAASADGYIAGINGKNGHSLFRTYLEGSFASAPVLNDFDEDGIPEAVLTSNDGEVFVLYHTGQILWQSRDETGGRPIRGQAAVAELTQDGTADVVVCDEWGSVHVLDGRTGFFERKSDRLRGPCLGSPVIGPTGDDGYPSIIVAGKSGMVYRLFGSSMEKIWEHDAIAPITSTPILYDFNGDGTDDVIIGCADYRGTVVVVDGKNGREIWSHQLGSPITASPKIAASLPEKPVMLCCTRNGITALDPDSGEPVWQYENPSDRAILSGPSLHDLNSDGCLDVIIGIPTVGLVVVDGNEGTELARFDTAGDIVSPAVLGDFDSDENLDIAVTDTDGRVTIVTSNRHVARNAVAS
jgi:outer membrane protein assembly factor BamB